MFLVPMTRHASDLTRGFDRLFDDDFFGRFFAPAPQASGARSPALELSETSTHYNVKLDLPGVNKDDVKVDIEGRRVTVHAEQTRQDEKKEGDRVIYSERSSSSYARSFMLPGDVDEASSTARLENGVLSLALAKRNGQGGTKLKIS